MNPHSPAQRGESRANVHRSHGVLNPQVIFNALSSHRTDHWDVTPILITIQLKKLDQSILTHLLVSQYIDNGQDQETC
jgi:hypothetical protein